RLDTFTVVLQDTVNPAHAPIPTNDSERLLFSQFSETLVRLDCRAELRPGLASQWTRDDARRQWVFTLRDSQNGSSSSAAARISSTWLARPEVLHALGIESADPGNEGRLVVTLRHPPDSQPLLFADPALAVSLADEPISPTQTLVLQSNAGPPELVNFRVEPATDPRDALDRGADLLVTRDPELAEYASSRPAFATFPLPWSRTYLLLQSARSELFRAFQATDSARVSLASDAVRAEARPAEPPFWWERLTCPARSGETARPTSSRIVYPRGDGVARGLAERIVALAGAGAGVRAAALSDSEFSMALKGGREEAYVVAAPLHSLAPCRDSSGWPAGASVTPLIDVRARAIVRRGSPPLWIDWLGTVRIVGS
ncbi:MAG TPA: hypothetical protein VFZ87_09155, partial [Gemmatimonadales bacterium]